MPPVDHQLGALGDSLLDIPGDPVAVLGADERSDLDARLVTGTHDHLCRRVAQLVEECVRRPADRHRNRTRKTPLARIAERRVEDRGHGQVRVGVGHDHDVVLGAAERLNPLAACGRGLVNVSCDRRRTNKRDRGDLRMPQQSIHRLPRPMHHIEHPFGKAGFQE